MRGADQHNLQGRRRRHPARRPDRRHRRRGLGQVVAHPRHRSPAFDDVVVDRPGRPSSGSRRSNPATYTGILDPIRTAFAKANGVKPALFSANSEGACPTCNGARRDLSPTSGFTADGRDPLRGSARARGFSDEVLEYTLGGKNISRGARDVRRPRRSRVLRQGRGRTPAAHRLLGAAGRRGARLPDARPAAQRRSPAASGSG